jgi:hypothetical protein
MRPDARLKDRLYLPLSLGAFVFLVSLLTAQLHLSIPTLLLLIASIPLWLWYLLRIWKYRPSSEEDLRIVRNSQIALTCTFVMEISLTLLFLLVFLPTFSNIFSDTFSIIFLPFSLIVCSIMLLSALVILILALRNDHLRKLLRRSAKPRVSD